MVARSFLHAALAVSLGLTGLAACSAVGDQVPTGSGAGGTGAGTTGAGGLGIDGGTGTGGAGGQGGFDGCHNVDVLFVIDDSGSMSDKQKALVAAFPGFVSTMKQKLAKAVSYHVGVVTS